MRGIQIARQWKILRLVERYKRGRTAQEIANELEINYRTVYRDLEALQDAGFPLYTERAGRSSSWRLVEGFKSDLPLPFTMSELASLHMSRDLMRVFQGTAFHDSIEELFQKVKLSLTPEIMRYLDKISAHVTVGFGPGKNYEAFKDIIAEISNATAQKRCVRIEYKAASTGRVTGRTVDPYQVWAMNGVFYLIGLCHLRGAVRTFAMDRIESFSVLTKTFVYPKDFSLEDYLQDAFRVMKGEPKNIQVHVAPQAAHVVRERIWHPSQEIREQDDGSLIVTLEVPINYEIISWVLGFGAAAEVLQPQELRQRILEEHQAAAWKYSQGKKTIPKKRPAEKISA